MDCVLHASVVFVCVQYVYHWSFCCSTVYSVQMNTCIATLRMCSTCMYDNCWIFTLCRVAPISKTGSKSCVSCVYTYLCYMTPSQWCVSGLFFSLSSSATSQAETSQYTKTYTTLPTSDELSHSTVSQVSQPAPPEIVIDVVVQQKCKVDVQNISHVSENQSSSGEYFMLRMYTIVSLKVIIQSVYFYCC